MDEQDAHRRPEGLDDDTVAALGSLSKALETTERARGHLFSFHQLTGTADLELDRAVELLRKAGHPEWAERVEREILGRNVIPGHWTFQIVEAYDRTYYEAFKDLEREAVERLADGRDHLLEAEMKEARRTRGHPDHTARPDSPGTRRPNAPFT
jgi:nucleotide-binding universal stress UspA family protein